LIVYQIAGIMRKPRPDEKNRTFDSADDTLFFGFPLIRENASSLIVPSYPVLPRTLPSEILSLIIFFPSLKIR
jgi:hypothetical protein